jgi:two-component system CheB/CheR fusion protein
MLLRGCRIDHMQLILLAIEDITEAKRSEAHRTMLMAELSHRVKNVLGVVQGLASQSLIRSKSLKEFGTVFEGRLGALARGHAQLLEGEWKPADLADVVQSVIEAFGPERVDAEGPRVEIPPRKALALNLILHELETNAVKYGAFSAPDGRIDLDWTLEDEDRIQLVWQERHGPPVVPPEQEGFGSTLIRQLLQYEMDGSARLSFEPDGLRCELVFSTR